MGFFGFGDKRQEQQASPAPQQQQVQAQQQPQQQQELTFPQKVHRIWHSDRNYVTAGGYEYDWQLKKQMDGRLFSNLGTSNLDDLMEIKAPHFYEFFYNMCERTHKIYKYLRNNIKSNNDYQQLLGKYEELQKHCEKQDALIQKLMEHHLENEHLSPTPTDNRFVR